MFGLIVRVPSHTLLTSCVVACGGGGGLSSVQHSPATLKGRCVYEWDEGSEGMWLRRQHLLQCAVVSFQLHRGDSGGGGGHCVFAFRFCGEEAWIDGC